MKKIPWLQNTAPTIEEGLVLGDIWVDTSCVSPVIKKCLSTSPILFDVTEPKAGKVTTDGSGLGEVIFNTPYVSIDYTVQLTPYHLDGKGFYVASVCGRTVGGFTIQTKDEKADSEGNVEVRWLASLDSNP